MEEAIAGAEGVVELKAFEAPMNEAPRAYMQVAGPHEFILKNSEFRRGYLASITTLCLVGGAVLPVPWAFSRTGAVAGTLLCFLVGGANVMTSDLLIRQCYKTGSFDYEDLAYNVGGPVWLVITRLSIIVLLFGTIVGSIQQAGEAAIFALELVATLPDWLEYKDGAGYVLMVLFTVLISLPLCTVRQLRFLGPAGFVGFCVIMVLTISIIVECIIHGLPALASGDFPAVGFTDLGSIADAVSVFGFAFYLQPLIMPLFNEMPGLPRHKARISTWAMRFAVLVYSGTVYFLLGFFGGAWYGTNTEGNILQNELLGGGAAQTVLNFLVAVYLSLSVPPLEFPIREILSNWLPGPKEYHFWKHLAITTVVLTLALAIALFWQNGSFQFIIVTGATGVLMACYVCPIVNHFLLFFNLARCQRMAQSTAEPQVAKSIPDSALCEPLDTIKASVDPQPSTQPTDDDLSIHVYKPSVFTYRKKPGSELEGAWIIASDVILPGLVVCFGAMCSAVSLYATLKPAE